MTDRRSRLLWVALLTALVFAFAAAVPWLTEEVEAEDVFQSPPTPAADATAADGADAPANDPEETATPSPTSPRATSSAGLPERPNILLISTDDQTDEELAWMPRTRRLLAGAGLELTDGVASHPICCPARSEMLTGRYGHNTGVKHNKGLEGGYRAFMDNVGEDHIGSWLGRAGYHTAFLGKSLNGIVRDGRPMRGWEHWDPTTRGTYAYYGATFYNDGDPQTYPDTYVADVVRDKTVGLIEAYADDEDPFFIWASHVGPHEASDFDGNWGPPVPASRHAELFGDVELPVADSPAFGDRAVEGKPRPIRAIARHLRPVEEMTHHFRERIRSLQAIDEANAAAIRALRRTGELDDTLVFFVSDNGFHHGEQGQWGKNLPYEASLQVPFLVRGPGVPQGATSAAPARLVDLTPTFLDLAGVLEQEDVDGASLVPTLRRGTRGPDTTLIQAGSENPAATDGWRWRGVRTARYTWVRWFNGDEELYDRRSDAHQLRNLVARDGRVVDPAYAAVRREMRRRYRQLRNCRGTAQCQRTFGPAPALE